MLLKALQSAGDHYGSQMADSMAPATEFNDGVSQEQAVSAAADEPEAEMSPEILDLLNQAAPEVPEDPESLSLQELLQRPAPR